MNHPKLVQQPIHTQDPYRAWKLGEVNLHPKTAVAARAFSFQESPGVGLELVSAAVLPDSPVPEVKVLEWIATFPRLLQQVPQVVTPGATS